MTKVISLPSYSFHWHKSAPAHPRWRWRQALRTLALPLLIALVIVIPIAGLLLQLLTPNWTLWAELWQTTLPAMLQNTLVLMIGVGVVTGIIGTGAAWLVSAYQFTGRAWFDRLLLLPLAIPTFVMGFVFMATFDYAGPVQTAWRSVFGREAAFPDIYSAWAIILVMSLVLYPYVYLLARAAFCEQTASTFEAAQVMGLTRWQTFRRLVLPLARPSLAAGVVLAMMEALTDYGTVRFFSYPTLSEGVVRIWEGRMDRDAAIQLALLLLLLAFGLMLLERTLRGKAQYYQQGGSKGRRMPRIQLHGWQNWGAFGLCLALLMVAFILPVYQLVLWALNELQQQSVGSGWQQTYFMYIGNSLTLAGGAALLVMLLALLVAHGFRTALLEHRFGRWLRLLGRFMTLGYALPGAVIAVGVLMFLAPLDYKINDVAKALDVTRPGLILTGTMTGLLYAYVVRFMAVGYNSVESSFDKITPNMEYAARTLGAPPRRVLWHVHLPLISSGAAAGVLLVFVDVLKELPATLLLRPFGMDTLALWAYFLAMESFWQAAALPALTILVVGLIPVLFLMRVGDQRTVE
jgi:iron(III) transport system permease protein